MVTHTRIMEIWIKCKYDSREIHYIKNSILFDHFCFLYVLHRKVVILIKQAGSLVNLRKFKV